ncbi:hypothetical protein ALC56_09148, partial [Trachymyrmex septentrionalis]
FEDRKKIAKIKFAALIVEKNISFKTAESILNFFRRKYDVLKSMTMNWNKAAKVIKNFMCSRKERLVEKLHNNKFSIFVNKLSLMQNSEIQAYLLFLEKRRKNSPNNSIQDVVFVAQRFGGFDEKILNEKWQCLKKDFTSAQKVIIINLHFDKTIKTKKRNKLYPNNVRSLCVFKSILRARGKLTRTMIVDARHLTLMTENLYKTNTRKNTYFCVWC